MEKCRLEGTSENPTSYSEQRRLQMEVCSVWTWWPKTKNYIRALRFPGDIKVGSTTEPDRRISLVIEMVQVK